MITIVDSGGANTASIQFALARLGVVAKVSHDANVIKQSSHLILPGVGSAESSMRKLRDFNLIKVIQQLQQPVLGICLGMQILFDFSEEGNIACLGLLSGSIRKINTQNDHCVIPHMGWNRINVHTQDSILKNIPNFSYLYFVHSYCAQMSKDTLASTTYGEPFSAAVKKNNFYGTQFHPERSSIAGSIVLKNFLEL